MFYERMSTTQILLDLGASGEGGGWKVGTLSSLYLSILLLHH